MPENDQILSAVLKIQVDMGKEFSDIKMSQSELHTQVAVLNEKVGNHLSRDSGAHHPSPCMSLAEHKMEHSSDGKAIRSKAIDVAIRIGLIVLGVIFAALVGLGAFRG